MHREDEEQETSSKANPKKKEANPKGGDSYITMNSRTSNDEYTDNISMDMSVSNSSVGAANAMSVDGEETEDDDSVKQISE